MTLLTLTLFAGMSLVLIYIGFLFKSSFNFSVFRGHKLLTGLIIWSFGYASLLALAPKALGLGMLFDSAKHFLILSFLISVTGKKRNTSPNDAHVVGIICSLMVAASLAPILGMNALIVFSISGALVTLLQLLLIERLYQLSLLHEKAYHSLVVLLLVMTLVDLALYCDLTLSGILSSHQIQWRGLVALFGSVFLWSGLNRLQDKPVRLAISKPLAFQGTLLLIAGAYILMMSIAAYALKSFDMRIDYITKLTLGGVATLPLIFALSSLRVRREVFVWINKHLFAAQFDYRKTWLTLIDKLDPNLYGKEANQQGLKTVLDAINHTSGAYFSVSSSGQLKHEASQNLTVHDDAIKSISDAIEYLSKSNWVIDVPDYLNGPAEYKNLTLSHEHLFHSGIRWVVPVVQDDTLEGILIVGEEARGDWQLNWETRDFLLSLAHQLERYIFAQATQQRLSENAQLAAFHQTSACIVHDLKNVHAQMHMLIKNGEKHRRNPDFIDDAFITLNSMQTRLEKTLGHLNSKHKNEVKKLSVVNISKKLSNIVNAHNLEDKIPLSLRISDNFDTSVTLDESRFANVISHLIDNARYACKEISNPEIYIDCSQDDNHVIIKITDNGHGMSDSFIDTKLFHPFETTKGNSGIGLGVFDAKLFVEECKGDISVKSELGKGSQFKLSLPKEWL